MIIYPRNVKTDYDKLVCVYSLVNQMRLATNEKAALSRTDRERYRAKFRRFARAEVKPRMRVLLQEQNLLKERIRWANYTKDSWNEMRRSPEVDSIVEALFGDRSALRGLSTKATSPLIDEVARMSLDTMTPLIVPDPTENYTTYTEVDPNTEITVAAGKIDFSMPETRVAYVYKDMTGGHFSGDYEHLVQCYGDSASNDSADTYVWAIANSIDSWENIDVATGDALGLQLTVRATGDSRMYLRENDSGTIYFDNVNTLNADTIYFIENERVEATGTYGTIYAYISTGNYWDDAGDQVDTLAVALHTSKKDFQYIYALMGEPGGGGATVIGYVQLLDLQEAGWAHKYMGVANASIGKISGVAIANIGKVNGV